MGTININLSIPYGASLRIGYRVTNSGNAFTYLTNFVSFDALPYAFNVASVAGTYDVELTVICPNCSLGTYSIPTVITATPS
jgi:hypothetical protein